MDTKYKPHKVAPNIWIVPCITLSTENIYDPLYKPGNDELLLKKLQTRQTWTEVEDDILQELITENGAKNWKIVADQLNQKAHEGFPKRKPKQCRERWTSNLDPSINKEPWSAKEDEILLKAQAELGNKWSKIVKRLESRRTENQVKNRFSHLKKQRKCGMGSLHDY